MITIIKSQKENYIRVSDVSTPEFNAIILVLRSKGLHYGQGKGSTHSNPKILLDTIYELNDNFETFVSNTIQKEIEEYNPYVPSFKPHRFKINESFFEKFPPKFPEQREDAIRAAQYGRYANFSKQGTGKTYSTIQTINQLVDQKLADRILIVVIPVLSYNWKREMLQFSDLFVEEDFLIVTEANREVMFEKQLPKVTITSYSTFRLCSDYAWKQENPFKLKLNINKKTKFVANRKKLIENQPAAIVISKDAEKFCKGNYTNSSLIKFYKSEYREKLNNYRKEQLDFSWWGTSRICVLDESHKAKNMTTRWTQIIHKEKKYFDFRFPLTGTPHPQGVQDLYSNIKFLDDNLVDENYTDFLRSIGEVGTAHSQYALNHIDEEKANKFLERIKPYFCRRFLRDVVKDLPSVYYKPIYIELEGKQKQLYQSITEQTLTSIKEEKGVITYRDVNSKFPYLISILSYPCLIEGKLLQLNGMEKWKFEDSLKFKTVDSLLGSLFEENPDEKIVIWDVHPDTISRLGKAFSKYNPIIVHGESTPKGREKYEWRDEQIAKFKNDSTCKLLIANPVTLGTGTNLQFVRNVIYFSRTCDFVEWDQSVSRAERIGMIGEVTYWILLVDKSLDIHVDTILNDKETLDRLFLKQGLTTKDCKDIFAGNKV